MWIPQVQGLDYLYILFIVHVHIIYVVHKMNKINVRLKQWRCNVQHVGRLSTNFIKITLSIGIMCSNSIFHAQFTIYHERAHRAFAVNIQFQWRIHLLELLSAWNHDFTGEILGNNFYWNLQLINFCLPSTKLVFGDRQNRRSISLCF